MKKMEFMLYFFAHVQKKQKKQRSNICEKVCGFKVIWGGGVQVFFFFFVFYL